MIDTLSVIISRCNGGLSSISSLIIIYIILKSNEHLSSIYHRIMFGMSLVDVIGSLAVALTTLPMPTSDTGGLEYFPEMTKLGNAATCAAQGFFIYFGYAAMFLYNSSLWIYYSCSIAIKMNEGTMKRRVEPFLHIVPIGVAFVSGMAPIWGADRGYGVKECERPYCTLIATSTPYVFLSVPFFYLSAFTSLIMILTRIWIVERNTIETSPEIVDELRHNVKVILIQASAYLGSYLISSSVVTVASMLQIEKSREVILAHLFLFPLQGFFNCLIFIAHKVYSFVRLHDDHRHICEVVGLLFVGTSEPVILTRISLIQEDREAQQLEQTRIHNLQANFNTVEENEDDADASKHSSLEADSRSGLKIYIGSIGGDDDDDDGVSGERGDHHDLSGFDINSWHSSEDGEAIRDDKRRFYPQRFDLERISENDSRSVEKIK